MKKTASTFPGIVSDTGEHPRFSEWLKAVRYALLCRKGKLVNLPMPETVSQKRSLAQNRYMWGLYGLLSENGNTPEEWHDMMRGLFLFEIIVVGDVELKKLISTATLDTVKMAEYIENFRQWQQVNMPKCYLPTPEEWKKWEEGEYNEAA